MNEQTIRFMERVETGRYVFIVYKMFNDKGEVTFHAINVFERQGERWLATQDLAEDQMFHHYLEGKQRVTRNVR